MRVNILCTGKVLGTAIGSAGNITYEANPGRFDRLATLEEAKAHCADLRPSSSSLGRLTSSLTRMELD